MASASQIINALESMPQGPSLSEDLRARLEEITAMHAGQVPIHGRLLAQWLHFVFPHECPYPHMGGLNPMTQEQWRALVGEEGESVSEEEVRQHLEAEYGRVPISEEAGKEMWALEETLLESSTPSDDYSPVSKVLQLAAPLGMIGSFGFMVFRKIRASGLDPKHGK